MTQRAAAVEAILYQSQIQRQQAKLLTVTLINYHCTRGQGLNSIITFNVIGIIFIIMKRNNRDLTLLVLKTTQQVYIMSVFYKRQKHVFLESLTLKQWTNEFDAALINPP